jgi:hypothetical protein
MLHNVYVQNLSELEIQVLTNYIWPLLELISTHYAAAFITLKFVMTY